MRITAQRKISRVKILMMILDDDKIKQMGNLFRK